MKKYKVIVSLLLCCILFLCSINSAFASTEAFSEAYNSTTKLLQTHNDLGFGSVYGEWEVIALSQNKNLSNIQKENYLTNLNEYLDTINSSQLSKYISTDNSRLVLALTSLNINAENYNGKNYVKPLADFDFVKWQGINGPTWALIALDSNNYDISKYTEYKNQTTRQKLIDYIISLQLKDGGFSLFEDTSDIDATAMAVTSLAPYYNTNKDAKETIDKAIKFLSDIQKDNGGYALSGQETSESISQVIVALTSLKINPQIDSRFIKNGKSCVDALLKYYNKSESMFSHNLGSNSDLMATEQAYLALVSVKRLEDNKSPLYNMTSDTPNYKFNDINNDGYCDINDCTEIQKYLAAKVIFSDEQIKNADCDSNDITDINDTTLYQKHLATKI